MQELKLTVFNRGDNGRLIQAVLDEFEKLHKIHIHVEILDWGPGWTKLVNCALYGTGPDLSEVGSTWVMDFVRMNAVSSLSPLDVTRLGSESDFFPTNWQSGVAKNQAGSDPVVWAIPWSSDIRLAYYRRDLFEKARLDPVLAFSHTDALDVAIDTLKTTGTDLTLALSTLLSYNNLHIISSWIWDAGGDLISPNGGQVAFDSPEALRGLSRYFRLGSHVPVARRRVTDLQADQLFQSGEAAILFSGFWIIRDNRSAAQMVRENLGVSAMPGASFVGGTHLLAWKHSVKREQALLLADFLVKHSVEYGLFPTYGLPAYIPGWQKQHLFSEHYAATIFNALHNGRSFPVSPLWGLVEKRLTDAIPIIWEKVWETSHTELDKMLTDIMIPLARRINITLE